MRKFELCMSVGRAEAIVNAVVHCDYASNASVQVMLFKDRLEVWNPGAYPQELSLEDLRHPHASIPRNPLIADALFLTRYIEKAGTGLMDMYAKCRAAGLPDPVVGPVPGRGVVQVVQRTAQVTAQVTMQADALKTSLLDELAAALDAPTMQVTMQVAMQVAAVMELVAQVEQPREALQQAMGLANRDHFRKAYLNPLMVAGWITRTLPDPNSPRQRYRITEKGRTWLERFNTLPKP